MWALHEPLECMMKKVLFSWFSIVFGRFWPCASMRLVVEINNISLLIFKCNLRFWKASKSGQKVRISDAENVWSCSSPTNWILNDHSSGFQQNQDFRFWDPDVWKFQKIALISLLEFALPILIFAQKSKRNSSIVLGDWFTRKNSRQHNSILLGDWFTRKNSRRHNSIYNIYWLLTRFKFVRLLTQLYKSSNLYPTYLKGY